MSSAPLVSVIVPHYNHARFLRQRIESILEQSYSNIEIILLDDASTDNGREIIAEFVNNYAHVHALYNSQNSGNTFKQWQKGIQAAKGDYIWIAESDDYASKDFLLTLLKPLAENSTIGISYCGTQLVSEDNTPLEKGTWMERNSDLKDRWMNNFKNSGIGECSNFLIRGNTIPNASSVLFRKELYYVSGELDLSFRYAGDWLLWSKMLAHGDITYCAEKLNFQRVHTESVTHKSFKDPGHFFEYHRVRKYILTHFPVPDSLRELCAGDYREDLLSHLLTARFRPHNMLKILCEACSDRKKLPELYMLPFLKSGMGRVLRRIQG